jgi:hypothetical protein
MNAVDPAKAGAASGILSMSRMIGGTFGVAVMGALVSALGKTRLGDLLPSLSATQRGRLADALTSGGATTSHVPAHVANAMREAFVYALGNGLRLGAGVAVVGAVLTWFLITRSPEAAPARGDGSAGEPEAQPAGI